MTLIVTAGLVLAAYREFTDRGPWYTMTIPDRVDSYARVVSATDDAEAVKNATKMNKAHATVIAAHYGSSQSDDFQFVGTTGDIHAAVDSVDYSGALKPYLGDRGTVTVVDTDPGGAGSAKCATAITTADGPPTVVICFWITGHSVGTITSAHRSTEQVADFMRHFRALAEHQT